MIVKTALLMAGGAAELEMGSGNLLSHHLNGLIARRPVLSIIFFFAAFFVGRGAALQRFCQ